MEHKRARHGEPVRTDEDHMHWDITDEDKARAKELGLESNNYDMVFSSRLRRAEATAKAALNDPVVYKNSLLNEINKPSESPELFDLRVYDAVQYLKTYFIDGDETEIGHNKIVFCHNRFMIHALNILRGQKAYGFDYLEHFTVEI